MDNFRVRANKFLLSRDAYPPTGAAANTTAASAQPLLAQDDMYEPGVSTRADQRVLSLPITSFPSINLQSGETASAGLTGAMAALGFGVSDQTMVTLDFHDVRTFLVPKVMVTADDQRAALIAFGGEMLDRGARDLPTKIAAKEFLEGHHWGGDRCLQLAIVTQVYLTREIDYTYRDRQILAAGLKATTEQGKLSSVPNPPAVSVTVLQSADGDNADKSAAVAESLRQSTIPTGTGPQGGSFSFAGFNARGMTFQQTYLRPVAIGWDGFEFDADPVGIPNHRNCHLDPGSRLQTGG
jgi:hypothetical protein